MVGQSDGQGVAGSGNQGAQQSAKPIICCNCGKPGYTRKDCHEKKTKLGMSHSDSDAEVYSELLRRSTISGIPCKCMIDTGANHTTVPAKLIQTHQYTGRTAKAILANRGIDNPKTAMVDLQVDSITKKSMIAFVIDGDANHILLGRDHPSVKAWISSKPAAEAVDVPIPLDAITRAQSQVLENEEVANQLAGIRDGAETKQLLSLKLKSKRKEAQKPNPFVHDPETQFTNLEVGLTKLADKGSSSTLPPAEE